MRKWTTAGMLSFPPNVTVTPCQYISHTVVVPTSTTKSHGATKVIKVIDTEIGRVVDTIKVY